MQVSEITFATATPIDGYGPGFFRVADQVLDGPICMTETKSQPWGGYEDTATLLALKDDIDFLLVGTSPAMTHVPATFRTELEEAGIGIEHMATPSACRTFNVLMAEGRRVAAALIPV